MAPVVGPARKRHRTTGSVIADGVARQVIDEFVNQTRYAFDDHGLGLMAYRHVSLAGNLLKTLFNRRNGSRELDGLRGPNRHRLAFGRALSLIQVGQRKDVVDERRQT